MVKIYARSVMFEDSLKLYSITRFWLKKPKVCFEGVAVNPMIKASKYSSTCRHRLYMERWHSSVTIKSKVSIGIVEL